MSAFELMIALWKRLSRLHGRDADIQGSAKAECKAIPPRNIARGRHCGRRTGGTAVAGAEVIRKEQLPDDRNNQLHTSTCLLLWQKGVQNHEYCAMLRCCNSSSRPDLHVMEQAVPRHHQYHQ